MAKKRLFALFYLLNLVANLINLLWLLYDDYVLAHNRRRNVPKNARYGGLYRLL